MITEKKKGLSLNIVLLALIGFLPHGVRVCSICFPEHR